ncbi:hypothetical protein VHEMI01105 [[Torrubiella] hemipterigena]|uniref:Uncharacterized protein n=1 Tax=[Torrubiella] hemipterigena TaxID=1531966 RepID=A0A0A1T6G1_9HYPO|nr:hypothetical protein VHEMI01105 [[Torrubiella] hemipterigena]
MSTIASFREWLRRKQLQIEVTFAVYMFTPTEKFAFYSIVFLLVSLTFIAAILYLPHHISILSGRVWYYINGDHIDVMASARSAVGSIMTSAVADNVKNNVMPEVTKIVADAARVKSEL